MSRLVEIKILVNWGMVHLFSFFVVPVGAALWEVRPISIIQDDNMDTYTYVSRKIVLSTGKYTFISLMYKKVNFMYNYSYDINNN